MCCRSVCGCVDLVSGVSQRRVCAEVWFHEQEKGSVIDEMNTGVRKAQFRRSTAC